jgi:hypothetical protein
MPEFIYGFDLRVHYCIIFGSLQGRNIRLKRSMSNIIHFDLKIVSVKGIFNFT